MTHQSSKKSGSRSQGSQSDKSSMTGGSSEQGNEAQSCPTPGEPRRDTSISSDEEEEE
ncbi:MAG: hypothetical protein ACREO3_05145 [Arenimonas sp.]